MAFKNFSVKVTTMVLLMAITSIAFLWTFQKPYLLVTNISLGIIWLIEIVYLIHLVRRTNRDLTLFLESIKFEDDTLVFKKGSDDSFQKLYDEFNRIIGELSKIKAAKEVEHQYFLNTVTHVPSGLISFDETGHIEIFNTAAEELLNISWLRNIKDLNGLHPGLGDQILQIESGKYDVIKVKIRNELNALLVRVAEFKLEKNRIKLVSIQNIRPELKKKKSLPGKNSSAS